MELGILPSPGVQDTMLQVYRADAESTRKIVFVLSQKLLFPPLNPDSFFSPSPMALETLCFIT